jgi:hypothetical protein
MPDLGIRSGNIAVMSGEIRGRNRCKHAVDFVSAAAWLKGHALPK